LAAKIYQITENLVERSARALANGVAVWTPQDDSRATYTRRRTPGDGRINWSDSSARIRNLIRATSHPFPGAFTMLNGAKVRVWRAEVPLGYRAPLKASPGVIIGLLDGGLLVSTRDNALLLTELQFDDEDVAESSFLAQRFGQYAGARFSDAD
jgi:methionyl-tRNA formyltransferase